MCDAAAGARHRARRLVGSVASIEQSLSSDRRLSATRYVWTDRAPSSTAFIGIEMQLRMLLAIAIVDVSYGLGNLQGSVAAPRFLAVKGNAGKERKCAATEEPECLDWCSPGAAEIHCLECSCEACAFCTAIESLKGIAACQPHDSKDAETLMCKDWCSEANAVDHCVRVQIFTLRVPGRIDSPGCPLPHGTPCCVSRSTATMPCEIFDPRLTTHASLCGSTLSLP